MNKVSRFAVTTAFVLASASSAYAGCGISSGSVRIAGSDFPAIQAVSGAAAACDGGGVSVTVDLNTDHKDRQVAALTLLEPVGATALAALFFGEIPTRVACFGAALVTAGVFAAL